MLDKISLYRIKKAMIYLRHYGLKEFYVHVKERLKTEDIDYNLWYQKHKVTKEELERQKSIVFPYQPVVSIVVPVYHTPVVYLEEMLQSVIEQSYSHWELCIANADPKVVEVTEILKKYSLEDARIKVAEVPENKGIAENTNAAIEIAQGEYIGFLDHDDLLSPDALYEIVRELNENNAEVLYSDEDKVTSDLQKHFQPHFKPEFNLDLLRSNNYICHFCVIKKSLIEEVGGLRGAFNGAQDYDLILRCTEKAEGIVRIPRVLYHWRVHKESTADNPMTKMYAYDAGKHAIEEHLKRVGEAGSVSHRKDLGFYKVQYEMEEEPMISVLIPNKDHVEDLEKCIRSIEKSTYKNYEIIVIENNSVQKETFEYYKKIQSSNIKIVTWDSEFNYSAINNYGALVAKGEYLLLLNNDVEAIQMNWIEEMAANCQRKNVGVVGAKLYFPDNTVQHAGTIVGIGGVAGNLFVGLPRAFSGYMHKANLQQNLSAVTAACLMVKKSVFDEVKGFDEKLKVAFNDVDFCLKVREKGYLVVYNPEVELYHAESKTRGPEDTKEKLERFTQEIDYMKQKWVSILRKGDPMYNPHFSLKKCDYSLKND